MPEGKYTAKQERKAKHIEESYEDKGVGKKEAKSRAWATVNKQDGGGKKGGSGEKKSTSRKSTSRSKKSSTTKSSTIGKKAAAGRKGGKAKARKAA
jgi:hypothetical protein